MPITYQQESLVTCHKEAQGLIQDHWVEIANNKDVIKLNPDWEAYFALEDQGRLKVFTARQEDILVGYFVVLVHNHLHYKDHLYAFNDVIYIAKEHRKGFVGPNLIRFAEDCLKEDGVSVMVVNTKTHKPFDKVLSWLGFKHTENIYTKLLR